MTVDNESKRQIKDLQGKTVEDILRRAVRHALLMHKRAGNPVAAWKDDKLVIIQPEDILIDDPNDRKTESSN